jgi:replicative DNA helicase
VSGAPAAIDEERFVLGAVMVADSALGRCAIEVGLHAEHFYYANHAEIYRAAQRINARGEAVSEIALWREVEGKPPEGVTRHFLGQLAAAAPVSSNVPTFARRIVESAGLRAKQHGAQVILEGVRERDTAKIAEGLQEASTDLEADSQPSSPSELSDDMLAWLEQGPEEGEALSLPWEKLNGYCAGGYRRGQMSVITGWSGFGKSLVALQMLKHWAGLGHRSLLLTTEMDRRELIARFLAAETGIAYEKLILRKLGPADWKKLMAGADPPMGRIPFHHHDAEGWSVERILTAIVSKRPDVAVVDPWNLIPHRDYFHMSETARQLKEIARRADCHVVVVAHLGKARLKEGKKPRPTQGDLRDSGMLYNNAHRVLCLHREQTLEGKEQRTGELFFMKSRDAPLGGIKVEFNPRNLRFDPKREKEPEPKQAEPEGIF